MYVVKLMKTIKYLIAIFMVKEIIRTFMEVIIMMKWIVIIVIAFIVFCVIATLVSDSDQPTKPKNPPVTHKNPSASTGNTWIDTPQRQVAARNAAVQMNSHKMNNSGVQAVQIKRVVNQYNVNVDISALNSAQDRITKICAHAERIRSEIERHRNDSRYLINLYRTGVGVSNEAYALRNEIKSLKDTLYRLSRSNTSLKPLFNQVNAFYNSVYADEVELNNRNRILRTYIGNNFGPFESKWNAAIEMKIKAKRS